MQQIDSMIKYAESFIGTPYGWGKDGGGQFDCSGFIQEVLSSEGFDPYGDQTAAQLFELLRNKYHVQYIEKESFIKKGTILFFGGDKITHVAMAINNRQMIEAGGGYSKTITKNDALLHAAMVRKRIISSRKDLHVIVNIF